MLVAPPLRVNAELLLKQLTSGRNKGVVVSARSPSGDVVDCVVKFAARLQVPPTEYLFEWAATAVGRALGVTIPEPFAVNVSLEFANAIDDAALRVVAAKSCGVAFGCEFLPGPLTQWVPALAGRPEIRDAASELLAFDVYVHNPDRRRDNPNLLVQRERVVAIDHDLAFGFCFPPTLVDPVTDPLLAVVDRHATSHALKGKLADLTAFRAALAGLTDQWFEDLKVCTPAEWNEGNAAGRLDMIIDVLRARRDRADEWLAVVEGKMS